MKRVMVSVIGRIDGNYVDGTIDSFGNPYNNATTTTIEYDDHISEIDTHDFVTRSFDITDILNPSITEHTLDFGISMNNIDDTDDEVRVLFDHIKIIAIEEDQYKTGQIKIIPS